MLIAVISDIHDNLANLEKCLNWNKNNEVEQIICCGDVTNSETLNFLSLNFTNPIHLIRGNMEIFDDYEIKKYNNIKYYGQTGIAKFGRKLIGFCHEPAYIEEILTKEKCDIIFYGHTHKPWEAEKNGVKLVNPGTLGGVFQKASFAFLDTDSGELTLKILDILKPTNNMQIYT